MSLPYFYAHQNPNAPQRANGRRFWGYPSRLPSKGRVPRVIVLHTAENVPDVHGNDRTAEALAAYGAGTPRQASWHVCVDADSIVECLPDDATAFHVVGYNTISLGVEICTQARRWGQNKRHDTKLLRNAAKVVARWSVRHDIPIPKTNGGILTKAEVDAGKAGITKHALLDPSRRSDPGPDFPTHRFLAMARARRRLIRARLARA